MNGAHYALKARVFLVVATLAALATFIGFAFTTNTFHLGMLRFNGYALLSFVAALLDLGVMLYLVSKPARTEDTMWLLLYVTTLFIYALTGAAQQLSVSPQAALFWNVASSFIVIGGPAMFLFALAYTNQSDRRYYGLAAFFIATAILNMFFACYTNIIYVNEIKYAVIKPWGFDFRTALGPGSIAFIALSYLTAIASILLLTSFRRHSRNTVLRTQSLFFIIALSFSVLGGTIIDVVLPMFGLTNLPPFDAILGTPVIFMLVYGFVRFKVLTVNPTLFSNTVLSIMQEAVVVVDKDFSVVFLNPEAEQMLGVKKESKITAKLTKLIATESLSIFEKAFSAENSDSKTIKLDHIDLRPPHTDPKPVRITSSLLKIDDYETRVMVLSNISDELHIRHVIEHEVAVRTEQLHRAQAYLVSSINSLQQGFVLVNQHAQVELVNTVASKLFGKIVDSTVTKRSANVSVSNLTEHSTWSIDLPLLVEQVLRSSHSFRTEAAGSDGSFYVVYITPILNGDKVLGATIVIENVTEQKILDRSKDEFFSIASHELRTPLTAIRGNMSLVQEYFVEALKKDNTLRELITDTHTASIRLIEIVNDFLDSSRLEQGKMQFAIAPVAVAPLVQAITSDLKSILDSRGDSVVLKDLDKLPVVAADEAKLQQILYNLISNAAKYSEHATITIHGEATKQHRHQFVKIYITDTGKGISPENQKLLFHKFQQAGASILTRENTKGTGLGLYISKLLATNMHGDVVLESSEVGKGSTFVVTLPTVKK